MSSNFLRHLGVVDVAIDLGTSKTAFFVRGEGVVLHEPTVLARRVGDRSVLAVGTAAERLRGKEPRGVETVRPLSGGVIERLEDTQTLLREMSKVAKIRRGMRKPTVLIGAPHAISDVERRAVREAAMSFGAKSVSIIPEPIASAIGAGLDIRECAANMVVDIGSGITEVVVISLGEIAHSQSVRVGGDAISEALIHYFRRHCDLLIGDQTVESIKGALCDVEGSSSSVVAVGGIDLTTRLPHTRLVRPRDVQAAIMGPIGVIVETVRRVMENTPPMLAGDLTERGMVLAGGGALIRNLDRLLARTIGIPVRVAKDPLGTVVRGAGAVL